MLWSPVITLTQFLSIIFMAIASAHAGDATTRPATADTPKHAIGRFFEAILARESESALALIRHEDASARTGMELTVRLAVADENLRRAILAAYDEPTAATLLKAGRLSDTQSWPRLNLEWLTEAEVQVTGDRAVVRLARQPGSQWDLVREGDGWVIFIAKTPADDPWLQMLPVIVKRTQDLAKRIESGVKAEEAREWLAGRYTFIGAAPPPPAADSTEK